MPVDTQQIMTAAEELGRLAARHPAVEKYQQAQRAIAEDPEAARLLGEFQGQLQNLARLQQAGTAPTEAQQQQVQQLETQLASHIKIKALSMAQVEFIDLLRKINEKVQGAIQGGPGPGAAPSGPPQPPAGPRLAT